MDILSFLHLSILIMRTASIIIGLFVLLNLNLPTCAQSVSIELSTRWVKTDDLFLNDSVLHCPQYHPELLITYRNNSDTNYYFRKISDNLHELPRIPDGILLQYPIEEIGNPLRGIKKLIDYSNQNYNVYIGDDGYYVNSWYILNDTTDYEEIHPMELINHDLANIYEYIYRELYKHPKSPQEARIDFSETEITPKAILDAKEKFVFLKPNEVFMDCYNLIAFSLLHGNFSFLVYPTNPLDYVYVESVWDNNLSMYVQHKKPLPKKVGEYHLYSGYFSTNELSISFRNHCYPVKTDQ